MLNHAGGLEVGVEHGGVALGFDVDAATGSEVVDLSHVYGALICLARLDLGEGIFCQELSCGVNLDASEVCASATLRFVLSIQREPRCCSEGALLTGIFS